MNDAINRVFGCPHSPSMEPVAVSAIYGQRMKGHDSHFQVAEMASGSYWHLALLRWSMVSIFIWFGIQKFTFYAAESIAPVGDVRSGSVKGLPPPSERDRW